MTLCLTCILQVLILLVFANGAPVLANRLFNQRWNRPVDGGFKWNDGRPLLGIAKTWRGLVSAVVFTVLVARLLGLSLVIGASFGILAMIGDMAASFIKRRLGLAESSRSRGLDTIPESLLPVLLLNDRLGTGWLDMGLIVVLFFLLEEWVSPILYRLHIRKRPY